MRVKELIKLLETYDQDTELAWQFYTKADVASNIRCDVEEITEDRFDVVQRWLGDWEILFGDIGAAENLDDYIWEIQ